MTTGFYFLCFGFAILLVIAAVYTVRGRARRKTPISPQCTGALPTPREALRELKPPQGQRSDLD